jgi:hypothetical protein
MKVTIILLRYIKILCNTFLFPAPEVLAIDPNGGELSLSGLGNKNVGPVNSVAKLVDMKQMSNP